MKHLIFLLLIVQSLSMAQSDDAFVQYGFLRRVGFLKADSGQFLNARDTLEESDKILTRIQFNARMAEALATIPASNLDTIQVITPHKLDSALAQIELLPGPQGNQGIQGIQGIQGTAGTNGTNGTNGAGFTNSSAATSATTGTMTVSMTTDIITITPTGSCTFNASGGTIGNIVTFIITSSGTTSRTLTFGTNFRKTGTLATGTTSGRFFAVTFRCINGTIWQEICRTAAQT